MANSRSTLSPLRSPGFGPGAAHRAGMAITMSKPSPMLRGCGAHGHADEGRPWTGRAAGHDPLDQAHGREHLVS